MSTLKTMIEREAQSLGLDLTDPTLHLLAVGVENRVRDEQKAGRRLTLTPMNLLMLPFDLLDGQTTENPIYDSVAARHQVTPMESDWDFDKRIIALKRPYISNEEEWWLDYYEG